MEQPKRPSCWEYPKKSGIRIRTIANLHAGSEFGLSYLVEVPARLTGASRLRRQFKALQDAEQWADETLHGIRKQGEAFFRLSDQERHEVVSNAPLLRSHGLTLTEAVQFAVKHLCPEGRNKTVSATVAELVASKQQRHERGDLREQSFRDFKFRTERFAAAFPDKLIVEISVSEIKAWLIAQDLSGRSNQNYLSAVGEVFKYATQRRYITSSPLNSLVDTDRKELCGSPSRQSEPGILTPAEAQRLLVAALANPGLELLGAVTLALFCGLRTEELKRLDWDSVRLVENTPFVTIGASIAKKRRIRHVDIPPNAAQWLALVPKRQGPVSRNAHFNDHQKRFQKLLAYAGFKTWKPNAMRHSFGTYHYALHNDSLATARLLGHKASDQVLFDHYRALATGSEGKTYFAIKPKFTP